jgi:hypothetical protein
MARHENLAACPCGTKRNRGKGGGDKGEERDKGEKKGGAPPASSYFDSLTLSHSLSPEEKLAV